MIYPLMCKNFAFLFGMYGAKFFFYLLLRRYILTEEIIFASDCFHSQKGTLRRGVSQSEVYPLIDPPLNQWGVNEGTTRRLL